MGSTTGQFPAVLKLLSKTSNVLTSSNTVNTTKNSKIGVVLMNGTGTTAAECFLLNKKHYYNTPTYQLSCPEIVIDGEDMKAYEKVMMNAPGNKYAKGFNVEAGDQG